MFRRGLGLIIYGREGVGKTSLALHFPNAKCFTMRETGFDNLADIDEVPAGCHQYKIDSWEELLHYSSELEAGDYAVYDSLSGLQATLEEFVCRTEFGESRKHFDAYSQGLRKNCPTHVDKFLQACTTMRQKGINIIFLGHEAIERITNPRGEDYVKSVIQLDEGDKGVGIRPKFVQWAQAVLWLTVPTSVESGKVSEANLRQMYTTLSPTHQAKNTLKLPQVINLGTSSEESYNKFISNLPEKYVPTTN